MPRSVNGAVRRAVTAAVEYGVARAGIAAVRALDHDVIGQAHHPRGAAGRVTAWERAHRPSNRQRNRWVVALLGIRPADQVLEIGFGPGLAIAELARAGAGHVYGIDHSGVMLRQAPEHPDPPPQPPSGVRPRPGSRRRPAAASGSKADRIAA